MLILMSGSSGAGKTTIGPRVATLVDDLVFHDIDEPGGPQGSDRVDVLDGWIRRAVALERDGLDMLLATQSPFGELLACPNADQIDALAGCCLDCRDTVRARRIKDRGRPYADILGMDIMCWAVFHRMHAADPQWEQRVICKGAYPERHWHRWIEWTTDDPRWAVPTFDTSDQTPDQVAAIVAAWIVTAKAAPPCTRARRWWESRHIR